MNLRDMRKAWTHVCEEGKTTIPKHTARKERTIRLPEEMDAILTEMADKNGHSVNAEILLALRMHIARRESAREDERR